MLIGKPGKKTNQRNTNRKHSPIVDSFAKPPMNIFVQSMSPRYILIFNELLYIGINHYMVINAMKLIICKMLNNCMLR